MKLKTFKTLLFNITRIFDRNSTNKMFCSMHDFISKTLKDTHREKTPSKKTPALTKSTNIDIWVAGTTNQFFIRGS